MATEMLGWASSIILLLTISRQVHKQWSDRSSKGVSIWLFLGQLTASTGFAVYSWLLGNWVFVFTNVAMALSAIVGFSIVMWHRQGKAEQSTSQQPA